MPGIVAPHACRRLRTSRTTIGTTSDVRRSRQFVRSIPSSRKEWEMPAHRIRRNLVGLASVLALGLSACTRGSASGVDDKAGGDAEPTVLTLADFSSGPYQVLGVQDFVDQVAKLS